jgi:hypothetical protein
MPPNLWTVSNPTISGDCKLLGGDGSERREKPVLLQSVALIADHPHDGPRRIQSGGNLE